MHDLVDADLLVNARGVSRTYGSGSAAVTAVVSATFRVSAGDRIALVGPSGSGKSTLLHLVGGLDRPTTGEIGWPGIGTREQLRPGPIAMAFQGPSLLPPLTVLENVALPMLLTGDDMGTATLAAQAFLERFEIDSVADKLPEELSGGQSQRACIARALAGGPKLILADEPTGQQDHVTGERLMDALLEAIGASGTALVVATHDPSVVERLTAHWSMDAGLLATEEARCSP